jgi:hypothetical protein
MLAKIAIIALYLLATGLLLLIRRLLIRPVNPTTKPPATLSAKPATKPDLKVVHRHHKNAIKLALFISILIHAAGSASNAQQTLFNVPSGDVLGSGKMYGELDVSFKLNKDPNNVLQRFSSFVPRVVIGAGERVEFGLNVTGNIQPGADTTTLVPAVKYKLYDGGDNGWAFLVGDHLFVAVRNNAYDAGNYTYAEFTRTFKTSTRLTFGGYHFSKDVVAAGAQRAGGQFGVEQTVNSKLSLVADWYTGKHAAGYFTPGITFKPHPKVTGYLGYSIGNSNVSRGNHFFLAEIGINFN